MKKDFFEGRKVLVMGLGRFGGGVDAARFAHNAGAKVTVTDLACEKDLQDSVSQLQHLQGIEFHLGGHKQQDFEQADIIIVNPAVLPENKFLALARRLDKLITSQIEIFFHLCPARTVGITGSNGKSTTASLTAHLLKNAKQPAEYENVWLTGNIGNQPMLTSLDEISAADLVVLELSSFQLEQLTQSEKAPAVALLTNLTPNHLDRHGSFKRYRDAKENIFKFQKHPAVSIFNAEDEIAAKWFEKYERQPGRTCLKYSADCLSADIVGAYKLASMANRSNLAAAVTIAGFFNVTDEDIISCLPNFKSLPHHLEFVTEINGVKWYNDSISTTPQSAIVALDAFEEPKTIIAGGYDKNLPFDKLGEAIARKAKAAVLIGAAAQKIADCITTCPDSNAQVHIAQSLSKAVNCAAELSTAGDVVLLSPACASYDMFENFQQRGRDFVRLVRNLEA